MSNNRKNLLMLHGALGAKSQFNEIEKALKVCFNVHTMNFTGHGGGQIPSDPFSIEMFADDILNFIDSQGIESINIFGYSMGGYAALYVAKHHPTRVNKIFTLATKFQWSEEIAAHEVMMLDARKIKVKVQKFAEDLSIKHGAANWEIVLAKTAEMMINLGNNNILKGSDFGEIDNEVLVGVGDRDKMVTLEETISVFRTLKNGKLLVMPSTPHPLEQVDAEVLVNEIERFF